MGDRDEESSDQQQQELSLGEDQLQGWLLQQQAQQQQRAQQQAQQQLINSLGSNQDQDQDHGSAHQHFYGLQNLAATAASSGAGSGGADEASQSFIGGNNQADAFLLAAPISQQGTMEASTNMNNPSQQVQHQQQPDETTARIGDLPMTFPQKMMGILSNDRYSEIISWLPHGKGFMILNKQRFAEEVMPMFFNKKAKFTSFTRKLNRWNFTRVTRGPETGAYYHPQFQEGNLEQCLQMTCIGSKEPQQIQPMNPIALGLAVPEYTQHSATRTQASDVGAISAMSAVAGNTSGQDQHPQQPHQSHQPHQPQIPDIFHLQGNNPALQHQQQQRRHTDVLSSANQPNANISSANQILHMAMHQQQHQEGRLEQEQQYTDHHRQILPPSQSQLVAIPSENRQEPNAPSTQQLLDHLIQQQHHHQQQQQQQSDHEQQHRPLINESSARAAGIQNDLRHLEQFRQQTPSFHGPGRSGSFDFTPDWFAGSISASRTATQDPAFTMDSAGLAEAANIFESTPQSATGNNFPGLNAGGATLPNVGPEIGSGNAGFGTQWGGSGNLSSTSGEAAGNNPLMTAMLMSRAGGLVDAPTSTNNRLLPNQQSNRDVYAEPRFQQHAMMMVATNPQQNQQQIGQQSALSSSHGAIFPSSATTTFFPTGESNLPDESTKQDQKSPSPNPQGLQEQQQEEKEQNTGPFASDSFKNLPR